MTDPFEHVTCTAPAERAQRMADLVLEHVPPDRALSVLDVGCGAGTLVFRLAEALGSASLVGVDISPANVRAAEAVRRQHAAAGRIRFVQANYLEFATPPVDVIVTDTALHFFRGGPDRLWRKLSGDLAASGVLVCVMAYDGAFNRGIAVARRALRRLRSAPVEAIVAGIATLAKGAALPPDRLRERAEYMYIPPEQFMTPAIRNGLARSFGLEPIGGDRDMPVASAAQLRQRVTVFVKHDSTR